MLTFHLSFYLNLRSIYYVSVTVLNTSQILSHENLITALWWHAFLQVGKPRDGLNNLLKVTELKYLDSNHGLKYLDSNTDSLVLDSIFNYYTDPENKYTTYLHAQKRKKKHYYSILQGFSAFYFKFCQSSQ